MSSGAESPCGSSPRSTLDVISPWITWLLVIVGWIVVHRTAEVRALRQSRRQEDLDAVRTLAKRVAALRDLAIQFFTEHDQHDSRASESHIKFELKSIAAELAMLQKRNPKAFDLTSEMVSLRRAITGGSFDSRSRTKVPHDHDVVKTIWLAAGRMLEELTSEFYRAYPG